jgi:hypothetical protein
MMTDSKNAMREAFTERRIPRERGSVYVRDFAGSGPAFLLLHGFEPALMAGGAGYGETNAAISSISPL